MATDRVGTQRGDARETREREKRGADLRWYQRERNGEERERKREKERESTLGAGSRHQEEEKRAGGRAVKRTEKPRCCRAW